MGRPRVAVDNRSMRIARLAKSTGRALARARALLLAIPGFLVRGWAAFRAAVLAVVGAIVRGLRWLRDVAVAGFRRLLLLGRASLLVAALAAILAVVLGGSAFAASRLSADYGAGQDQLDAVTWAGRPASYAGATCLACHPEELQAQSVTHPTVNCEGCHGPLVGHPASVDGTDSRLVFPDSGICVDCHADARGRPSGFPQVDLDEHYPGNECLACHGPHAVVAAPPPDVTHPLVRLPACITCHAPDGLKELPSGHEAVADEVCLSCHGAAGDDD